MKIEEVGRRVNHSYGVCRVVSGVVCGVNIEVLGESWCLRCAEDAPPSPQPGLPVTCVVCGVWCVV